MKLIIERREHLPADTISPELREFIEAFARSLHFPIWIQLNSLRNELSIGNRSRPKNWQSLYTELTRLRDTMGNLRFLWDPVVVATHSDQ